MAWQKDIGFQSFWAEGSAFHSALGIAQGNLGVVLVVTHK
jgi:hypothetical protein